MFVENFSVAIMSFVGVFQFLVLLVECFVLSKIFVTVSEAVVDISLPVLFTGLTYFMRLTEPKIQEFVDPQSLNVSRLSFPITILHFFFLDNLEYFLLLCAGQIFQLHDMEQNDLIDFT